MAGKKEQPSDRGVETRKLYKARNVVGYCSPPVEFQFKKGQPSRNPRGRPKNQREIILPSPQPLTDFHQMQRRIADQFVPITRNGKKVQIPIIEAIELKRVERALAGDVRAAREIQAAYERSAAAEQAEKDRLHDHLLAFIEDTNAGKYWEVTQMGEEMIEAYAEGFDDLTLYRVRQALEKHRKAPPSARQRGGVVFVGPDAFAQKKEEGGDGDK